MVIFNEDWCRLSQTTDEKAWPSLLILLPGHKSHGSDIGGLEMVFVDCAVGVALLQQILQGSAQRRL
jgi:hypothetical protein